jgi:hypothetical protein
MKVNMQKNRILISGILCALLAPTIQPSFAAPHSPKTGSVERKAIMDSMRTVVGKGKKKKVIFVADHLKVEKGWAYFAGNFKYADGTRPGQDYAWGNLSAVLHLENKKWKVKRYVHNTDVIEPELIAQFPQAPKAIFTRTYTGR